MASSEEEENKMEQHLEWIQLRKDMKSMISPNEEGLREKLLRKTKENPFVPVGCLATTAALSYGLWSMRTGQRKMSQYMMRARILAQGFTVVAIIIGLGIGAAKKSG
ncbi:HIG1 domain family member 2A-like [Limulus polyphemus]|uniref:HIG1 domain family member 2A-like n=1 Tax=Limulus polyphemus TaxID=6850 RepID=A0ABM1T9N4_LIMPO|nr:HIG1 domain family member 2A-like [Limulus polyphemus]XP_022252590.1 HIG1 domain family member 2A-like [Limulus polyphemus]XP_022252591.1 HIG1 domain family member 2A-like [Limulus polyphemus]